MLTEMESSMTITTLISLIANKDKLRLATASLELRTVISGEVGQRKSFRRATQPVE